MDYYVGEDYVHHWYLAFKLTLCKVSTRLITAGSREVMIKMKHRSEVGLLRMYKQTTKWQHNFPLHFSFAGIGGAASDNSWELAFSAVTTHAHSTARLFSPVSKVLHQEGVTHSDHTRLSRSDRCSNHIQIPGWLPNSQMCPLNEASVIISQSEPSTLFHCIHSASNTVHISSFLFMRGCYFVRFCSIPSQWWLMFQFQGIMLDAALAVASLTLLYLKTFFLKKNTLI